MQALNFDEANSSYDNFVRIELPQLDMPCIDDSFMEGSLFRAVPSPSTDPPEDSASCLEAAAPNKINVKAKARKSRIKDKVTKAKSKFPDKSKLIKKESNTDKKQTLIVRNRLSAQRSREKKKEQLEALKKANDALATAKVEAEQKLALVTAELEAMKATVELLSPESHEEFNRIRSNFNNDSEDVSEPYTPSRYRTPFLLAGAWIGCICLICCISPFLLTEQVKIAGRGRALAEIETSYIGNKCPLPPTQNDESFSAKTYIIGEGGIDPGIVAMEGRSLKPSNSTEIALYEKRIALTNLLFFQNNGMLNTIYVDNAYLVNSMNKNRIFETTGGIPKYRYLQLLIPVGNLNFLTQSGEIIEADKTSDEVIMIKSQVMAIDTVDPTQCVFA